MKTRFRLSPDWKDPVIAEYEKDVDVTLLRENLKLTVEQRLAKFERMQELYEELHLAGVALRAKKTKQGA
jgi:hypothetical protein